jgi:hypothetical protein
MVPSFLPSDFGLGGGGGGVVGFVLPPVLRFSILRFSGTNCLQNFSKSIKLFKMFTEQTPPKARDCGGHGGRKRRDGLGRRFVDG